MRFIEGGPSLPDALLRARDEGRVVFFCGAGVSRARAGLEDFGSLAEFVGKNRRILAVNGPIAGNCSPVVRHFFRRNHRHERVIDSCGERNGWVLTQEPSCDNRSTPSRVGHWGRCLEVAEITGMVRVAR